MNSPKISVITPVYNMENFIGPAIQSVLDQTFDDFELLLIDDCSTDGSRAVMEEYAAKDARVKIFSTSKNSWAHVAGNVGLDNATGKYIAILDGDDLLPSDRFARQIAVLDKDPQLGVCGGWMKLFGDSEKTIDSFQRDDLKLRMGLLFDSTLGHGTAMIRRKIIEDHNIRYDTEIFYAHDYHFFTQLAFTARAKFTCIPHVVYYYRWHLAQTSIAKKKEQIGFSDRVRNTVLERFGISEPGMSEIHLHFCHKEPYKIDRTHDEIVAYYEALIEGNLKTGIFPDREFRRYLATKVCSDMRRCGLGALWFYLSFPYKKDVSWSFWQASEFFIKSLRPRPKQLN